MHNTNKYQHLLNWYDLNKRILPWRKTNDPYMIWLSEVMLQQTQVSVVIPYYNDWIEKYPTVQSVAEANLDELLEEGESRTAFILRFTLSHPDLNTTIVGTKNKDHFQENIITANKGRLSEDVYKEAKKRLAAIGVDANVSSGHVW